MTPLNLSDHNQASNGRRMVLEFVTGELVIEHGVVQRIEFTEKRCNLTLRNSEKKPQPVGVKVWVLNRALIEIWSQTERWRVSSLQPDQSHLVSWAFATAVPDVVWNTKARDAAPQWIVVETF